MSAAFTSFPTFILNLASRRANGKKPQNFKFKTKSITGSPFGGPKVFFNSSSKKTLGLHLKAKILCSLSYD